jgi:hypothetical protein
MQKEILELQYSIKRELENYYFSKGILIEFNYEKEFLLLDALVKDCNKVGLWYYIYAMFFIPISAINKAIRIDISFKTVGGNLYTYFEIVDNISAKEEKHPWWSFRVIFVVDEKTENMMKFEEKYNLKLKKRFNESLGTVFTDEIYMPLESFVEPKVVFI